MNNVVKFGIGVVLFAVALSLFAAAAPFICVGLIAYGGWLWYKKSAKDRAWRAEIASEHQAEDEFDAMAQSLRRRMTS